MIEQMKFGFDAQGKISGYYADRDAFSKFMAEQTEKTLLKIKTQCSPTDVATIVCLQKEFAELLDPGELAALSDLLDAVVNQIGSIVEKNERVLKFLFTPSGAMKGGE